MRGLLVAIAVLVAGCAAGRVAPSGEIVGVAIGYARLERCHQGYEDEARQMSVEAGQACSRIEGGAMSQGLAEFLAMAGTAVGAWFGLGL